MRIAQINESTLRNLESSYGLRFAGASIGDIISNSLGFVFLIAGFLLTLYLLYGGYLYMFSGGNQQSMAHARSVITNALLGFFIIFTSFWIIQFIAQIFGLTTIKFIFL